MTHHIQQPIIWKRPFQIASIFNKKIRVVYFICIVKWKSAITFLFNENK